MDMTIQPLRFSTGRWWQTLTTPPPFLTGEARRQTRLLMAMLVVLIPITLLGGASVIYQQLTRQDQTAGDVFAAVVTPGAFILLYLVSRSKYSYWASLIFAIAPTVLLGTGALLAQGAQGGYFLYYMMLSTLLASLLLTVRVTIMISLINLGLMIMLVFVVWNGDVLGFGLIDEITFNVLVPALLIVSVSIRQQYQQQITAQIVELEQAEHSARAAQEKAERADRVKSAFLASMSHELRTPLNAAINFTSFVLDGDMGPINDQQAQLLTEVVSSNRHLLSLINDVLDMSKIEAGALTLFLEDDVNLNGVVDDAVATARGLLLDRPVRLQTEVDPALPPVRGDRQRLFQILLNLLSNACKFTEQGQITVRARRVGGEVQIAVIDSGPGIAPADQGAVFEAFKQTDSGLRKGGGTGLGMPISRNLAEAHGGRLWLESEPGKGATFTLALPVKLDPSMMTVN